MKLLEFMSEFPLMPVPGNSNILLVLIDSFVCSWWWLTGIQLYSLHNSKTFCLFCIKKLKQDERLVIGDIVYQNLHSLIWIDTPKQL